MSDAASSTATEFCLCERYHEWYLDNGVHVCRCGHPLDEHVAGLFCLGEVYRLPAYGARDAT